MTNEEASRVMQHWMLRTNDDCPIDALCIALDALEKQIPKPVETEERIGSGMLPVTVNYCTVCHNSVIKGSSYCQECGQHLKWGGK